MAQKNLRQRRKEKTAILFNVFITTIDLKCANRLQKNIAILESVLFPKF